MFADLMTTEMNWGNVAGLTQYGIYVRRMASLRYRWALAMLASRSRIGRHAKFFILTVRFSFLHTRLSPSPLVFTPFPFSSENFIRRQQ